ncbi:MAG: hypothetical protein K2K58_05860 [Muribaculaceae bacterium]|nr:hypothetical protein [Muribaculaceae bacterium]
MKNLLTVIGFILLITLAACRESVSHPALDRAAALMDSLPDSAAVILKGIAPENLDNGDQRMYCRLLLLEFADKTYHSPKDDKEIKEIMNYFIDGNRAPQLHPEIYYYAGRTYAELNKDALALSYFDKALHALKNKDNLELSGRIHAQIGGLFQIHNLHAHAINHFKEYRNISEQRKDTADIIGSNLNVAFSYCLLNHSDSAKYIYDTLKPIVESRNDSILYTTYYTQLAQYYYYISHDVTKADSILRHLNLKFDDNSKLAVLSIKSDFNFEQTENEVDEGVYQEILKESDPALRFSAAKYLALIAKKRRDADNLLYYSMMLYDEGEKIQQRYNRQSLVEIAKIIDETRLKNENLKLELKQRENEVYILFLAALVLVLAIIFSVISVRNRINRIKLTQEIDRLKIDKKMTVISLERDIMGLKDKIEEYKRTNELAKLEKELSLAREVEKMINVMAEAGKRPTDEDFVKLKNALQISHPNFISNLDKMDLKWKDYQDAMLIKIGVPQKLCAIYFDVSTQAISNSRKRLFQRYGTESDCSNWQDFIQSLG